MRRMIEVTDLKPMLFDEACGLKVMQGLLEYSLASMCLTSTSGVFWV